YRNDNGKPGTAMTEAEAKSAGPGTYWIIATVSTTGCADTGSLTISVNNCGGLIYETNVTCHDYLSAAPTLDKICYTVATTTKGRNTVNTITNATPGVFFYYAGVVSPGGTFTVDVHQFNTSTNPELPNFAVQKGQVYAFNANCTKIATGRLVGSGDASVTISGVPAGEMVVISVKYDIKTIVGKTVNDATGPDYQAYFISKIGESVLNSTAGNIHVYNCTATPPPPVTTARVTSEATVIAYPNPYTDEVNFNIQSPVSGRASLEVYDLYGRKIAVVYEGNVEAGIRRTITYRVPITHKVPMIYRFRLGDQIINGKLFPNGGIHY
ncbi:MAG TPA: hypothetical protein VFP87_02230, partial [Chitinophagaceae bacterium]|nr:hypothetical protein [Chitinophagaceae bacterium]